KWPCNNSDVQRGVSSTVPASCRHCGVRNKSTNDFNTLGPGAGRRDKLPSAPLSYACSRWPTQEHAAGGFHSHAQRATILSHGGHAPWRRLGLTHHGDLHETLFLSGGLFALSAY